MAEIKDRMIEFLTSIGKDKTPAAIEMGLSRSTFNNDSEVGGATIKIFHLTYPKVDLHWLITGEGQMIVKNLESNSNVSTDELRRIISTYEKAIEMLYSKFQEEKSNH